jgi:hypothetical protein
MAIDEYYDYCYGKLPYRSIKFDTLDVELPKVIPTTNVNFTYGPCTRVTEWKNIPNHGTNEKITTLTFETPCDPEDIGGEKYYPVITEKNRELYKKYKDIKNDKASNRDLILFALKSFYNRFPIFLRPILLFLYSYFIRLGILDGKQGLIWNVLQVFWYRFLVDSKVYELQYKCKFDSDKIYKLLKEIDAKS